MRPYRTAIAGSAPAEAASQALACVGAEAPQALTRAGAEAPQALTRAGAKEG